MKNIYYIITIFGFFLLWTSCDLETSPTDAIEEKEVFKSTESTEKVLIGTWSYLMETYYSFANPGYGAMLRTNDAMGNDVVLNDRYGFSSHYAFKALYGKGGTNTHVWSLLYKTINNANNVIENVENAHGTEEEKSRIKGQAYALRGFAYLNLASGYAFALDKDPDRPTAPIYVRPTQATTERNEPAKLYEVYRQSLSDLEMALHLIPESYNRNKKFKIDRQVTLGLLARASLYAREWEKAKQYSDQLLEMNDYLMSELEYKSGFNNEENKEWIWAHGQTAEQSDASYQFHFLDTTSETSYYYSFNADPYFKELFDDEDYRKNMIFWATDPGKNPENESFVWMRYAKFKFKAGSIADIVLMRVSEIYLINAEAKARLGDDSGALQQLNLLRASRNAPELHGFFGKELLQYILVERRKELFGEGFALIDILRTQQKVVRKEYPQTPIAHTYIDESGNSKTVNLIPQGHHVLKLPDGSEFVENSKYYLFRIPDEEIQ